ncbi:MAG TPA: hypothetical protein VMF66_11165 [Candidatus Acidoferrum sp.]|nr:hypothetical protein [Candidatus Acidoferrum sp.]
MGTQHRSSFVTQIFAHVPNAYLKRIPYTHRDVTGRILAIYVSELKAKVALRCNMFLARDFDATAIIVARGKDTG